MISLSTLFKNRIENGRYYIYEKDTTDLANVYTLDGSEYVSAPNPIYCVDGLADNTYFVENRIYDVLAQEYVGDSSDPQGDLRPEMWTDSFTTKIGFELDKEQREADLITVNTISTLKDTPVGGFVNVIGYWTDNDCESRTYYWDEDCVNFEDGGLVIGSNVSDTGKWILICNEIMKSEYYGVYGDHQENLNNLFGYYATYGSMALVSPKTIMLAPGSYGDGYSLYIAGGQKVIFSYGARLNQGNTLKCLSFEGTNTNTDVLGNIQIGFNENGQWNEERANQPVRLSTYNSLDDFLNSWSKYLIFDKEGSQILHTTKTLEDCICVFEKELFIDNEEDVTANLIFNNCTIVSDGKLTDAHNVRFKNMIVTDRWFKDNVIMYPDHSIDTGNTLGDFKTTLNYWVWLTMDSPSSVTANFEGMKNHSAYSTFTANGLSAATINNLTCDKASFGTSECTLNNCLITSAYVTSPNVELNNCKFEYGYVTANGGSGHITRNFNDCKFGSTMYFTMENATAVDITAYNCDFGTHREIFKSTYGLDLGVYPNSRGTTTFRNNIGLGDNTNPFVTWNGAASTPASLVSGAYKWYDEVGTEEWNNGFVSYKLTPNRGTKWQDSLFNKNATAYGISYACDFRHLYDNKVANMDEICISATFSNSAIGTDPFIFDTSATNHFLIRLGRG